MSKKKKAEPPAELAKGCSKCHGRPHVIAEDVGGARRCDCPRGRRLAEMDREKGIKSQPMAPAVKPEARRFLRMAEASGFRAEGVL